MREIKKDRQPEYMLVSKGEQDLINSKFENLQNLKAHDIKQTIIEHKIQ